MNRKATRRLTTMVIYSRGIALIELMIAMVLGLVIIGAVTGIMLSNIQGFRTTRGLSQIQDSARVGYELIARDIRQAANVPCGNDVPIVNILKDAQVDPDDIPWQYDFANGFRGLAGDDPLDLGDITNRVDGTEALVMLSGDASNIFVSDYPLNNNGANFTIDTASGEPSGLVDGEILMICNEKQATIFQLTKAASGGGGGGGGGNNGNGNGNNGNGSSGEKIVVNTGNSQKPGNCSKGFGDFTLGNCTTNNTPGPFDRNAVIARVNGSAWYIGNNGRDDEGGRSLYMARLNASAGNAVIDSIEIAAGVTDMRLRYRLVDTADFIDADAVSDRWAKVNAVELSLDLFSQDQNISTDASVDQGRLSRGFTSVVAIRNRSL